MRILLKSSKKYIYRCFLGNLFILEVIYTRTTNKFSLVEPFCFSNHHYSSLLFCILRSRLVCNFTIPEKRYKSLKVQLVFPVILFDFLKTDVKVLIAFRYFLQQRFSPVFSGGSKKNVAVFL